MQPGYWRPKRSSAPKVRQASHSHRPSSATGAEAGLVNGDAGETLDPDVAAEAARVWDNTQNPIWDSHNAFGLWTKMQTGKLTALLVDACLLEL